MILQVGVLDLSASEANPTPVRGGVGGGGGGVTGLLLELTSSLLGRGGVGGSWPSVKTYLSNIQGQLKVNLWDDIGTIMPRKG